MSNLSFWQDTTRIRVYQCPACHETISADAPSCRFCHVSIDAETAKKFLAQSEHVTNVITEANTFSAANGVAVLTALGALYYLYVERSLVPALVIAPVVAIGYGALWLFRNSSLVTYDPDFPSAVRKVKGTMFVAAAVVILQLATYFVINFGETR
jgi:hypothetical protein